MHRGIEHRDLVLERADVRFDGHLRRLMSKLTGSEQIDGIWARLF